MMRIAYASPVRPQPSGVSDYTAELAPALARTLDLTLVTYVVPADPALAALPRIELDALPSRAGAFDAVLYHIGNAPLYAPFYSMAGRVPGVVVLHDLVLHHLRAWQTIERGDAGAYFDALGSAYGPAVAQRARANPAALNRFDYPLSEDLVRAARGVIVHSEYAARHVRAAAPGVPVAVVPMGIRADPPVSRAAARARLGVPDATPLVAGFGEVHPHKRIAVALEAFAEVLRALPPADGPPSPQLVLVGSESPNYDVGAVIRAHGLERAVRRVGFVAMDEYRDWIAASDICLNLRYPSAGETSASLLRLLAAGRVTFVTRAGAAAELPDDVCVHVEPDAHERRLLVEYLTYFLGRPDARAQLEARARAYADREHSLERAVAGYVAFLAELVR